MTKIGYNCSFELTIEILGGKWKSVILWYLNDKLVLRNGELLRLIPRITQKMLTQQLREMESYGLVKRVVYRQVPPKVEYSLTKCGKELQPLLNMMKEWGDKYAKNNGIITTCENR